MRNLVALAAAFTAGTAPALADPIAYEFDRGHSSITATWNNMGISRPTLMFESFDGVFELDLENPSASTIEVTIDTASLNTGVDGLDNNLRSEWYFNTEAFPAARFVATDFVRQTDSRGVMIGNLTLLSHTHPVALDVTLNHAGAHPLAPFRDNLSDIYAVGFSARTTVSRSAFGLGLVRTIPDEIDIQIELALERQFTEAERAEQDESGL